MYAKVGMDSPGDLFLLVNSQIASSRYLCSFLNSLYSSVLSVLNDIYADMLEDNHLFDFSGYQDDHPCFANMSLDDVKCIKQQNKKVIG